MFRSMLRRLAFLASILVIISLTLGSLEVISAQEANAWSINDVNLRVGPGTQHETITTLPANTPFILEARNRDTSWVVVITMDKNVRGWVKTTLLKVSQGVKLFSLPHTEGLIPRVVAPPANNDQPPAATLAGLTPTPGPIPTVILDRGFTAPVIPQITSAMRRTARDVLAKGKSLGNNIHVFSKVGDCMSDHWAYLNVIGWKKYNLGQYGHLQDVIGYFSVPPRDGFADSYSVDSQASHNGFSSTGVLNKEFINTKGGPALCFSDESPLICEFRLNKPAVALIMFGTADVLVMTPREFNYFMREIVKQTMNKGVLPILSTFPENPAVKEQSRQINQVVLTIAREKGLPVMNLQAALEKLPNNGIDNDGIHLTVPPDGNSGFFDEGHLQFGYTVRNLVTLQTLDVVWKQLLR
jgi:uncharacterized protein YraI